ncbi:MAG TPA: YciI family protein, partial [Lapillicoccus sp.]|nr:YciI family protein [Lapillicoccus sp.]
AHHAFEQAVYARGRLVSGDALADTSSAFTVRHREGSWQRTDGPFAETAEQIGGFYVIDVPDQQAAQEIAQCLPRQYTVEVRPTIDIDGYERSHAPA